MEVQILQTRHRKNMRTATVKKMQKRTKRGRNLFSEWFSLSYKCPTQGNSPDNAAKRMRMVLNALWRN